MRIVGLIVGVSFAAMSWAAEVDTKFLLAGKPLYQIDFNDGTVPDKPVWRFRKTKGTLVDGAMRIENDGGNGAFIRLQSKENEGLLPEDYVMTFRFKVERNAAVTSNKPVHETYSTGNRFSIGHCHAKFQWKGAEGMVINASHDTAFFDKKFHVERGKWYQLMLEMRGDEVLVWFQDGPAYYLKREALRHKPAGFELFVHASEFGFVDDFRVYALAEGTRGGWPALKKQLAEQGRSYVEGADKPAVVSEKTLAKAAAAAKAKKAN